MALLAGTPVPRQALLCAVAALVTAAPAAQAPGRLATNPQALIASPIFFHGRQVAVRGRLVEEGAFTRLEIPLDEAAVAKRRAIPQIFVFSKESRSRSEGEIRGEFWDLGRISSDDGRFSGHDFRALVEAVLDGRWPARDELFVLVGATIQEPPPGREGTVREIVMNPDEYANREVTVSGRFRGRNIYGDLPGPLNKSKWDFVLQSADAAIWVVGMRPRGKGFDLDPGARVDTGRWLEVAGVVHVEGPAVWIEAKGLQLAAAPQETPVEIVVPVAPRQPAPEVVFSSPVAEEIDVDRGTTVRIQFSRDMDPKSFDNRVRVRYVRTPAQPPPDPPAVAFSYNPGLRALQIKLAAPLERFATISVELLEGITATDGQPLQPWTLTFTTGS